MQEAVKGVKHAAVPGVFAGVLGVLYTVLLGHHSMRSYTEAALEQRLAALPAPQVLHVKQMSIAGWHLLFCLLLEDACDVLLVLKLQHGHAAWGSAQRAAC